MSFKPENLKKPFMLKRTAFLLLIIHVIKKFHLTMSVGVFKIPSTEYIGEPSFSSFEGTAMLFDQMNEKMMKAVLETLPVELTIIDVNDEVVGWNRHDNRLFKRPLTSMGVNFRYCHPAESLSKVIQIVDEMKKGERDAARFWIDFKAGSDGKRHKVLIEFFALRNDQGDYLGCMECTQDVEEIRNLEGEKRLLD